MSSTPKWTYWTTDRGGRHETRHRRCTTCGNVESYAPGRAPRGDCLYRAMHRPDQQPPQYTGGTPST